MPEFTFSVNRGGALVIQIRLQNLLEPVDKETHAPRQIVPVRHHDQYWQGFRTQIGEDFDQLTQSEMH